MRVRAGGAWRDVTRANVRVGGSFQPIKRAIAYENDAWREVLNFTPDLTASASPPSAAGQVADEGVATTNTVTVTPEGGAAPYSYVWARVGAGSGVARTPSSASTSFQRYVTSNESAQETFRCTVTDNDGTTVSVDVTATFTSFGIPSNEGFE